MKCPTCGADLGVIDSRHGPDFIRRRRECFNGHRFTTREEIVASRLDQDGTTIPKHIREIAVESRAAGLTREQVAKHLGLSVTTITRITNEHKMQETAP